MFGFDMLFWPLFIFILAAVVAFIIFTLFIRSIFRTNMPTKAGNQPAVIEKEIIREIVKIRCPYCNNLYDEKLDKCPHCGAKHA
jgi:hypothetical protein